MLEADQLQLFGFRYSIGSSASKLSTVTTESDCIGRKPRLVFNWPTRLQTKFTWIGEAPDGRLPASRFGIQPGKSAMTVRARALAMAIFLP